MHIAVSEGKRGSGMIRKRIPAMDDRSIHRLIVRELLPYTRETFPGKTIDRRALRARLNRAHTRVAAFGQTKPAHGFIVFFQKERKLFVDMLAVSPEKQGQGLGSRLMARAESFGKRKGCETANLFVDRTNEKAIRFYEKLGYSPVRYEPAIRCYLMSKPLA